MSDDMIDPAESVLSQSDIDALMNGGGDEIQATVYRHSGGKYDESQKVNIELYDFRNPIFLTENELRQVRVRNERFIHYLSSRLSMFLRMDFSLKMSKLHTTQYSKFTESIPSPTHINLFSVTKLTGVGLLEMNPCLAITMVNRILGGKGHSVSDERYLTEIESALMGDIVEIIMDEWCNQWDEIDDLNSTIIGAENNGRFLQTAPQDAIMLILTMEAGIGDCSGEIQIAVPYYMMEPVIKKMQAESQKYINVGIDEKRAQWMDAYSGINVNVTAQWDACSMSVRDLLHLRPGDVVELSQDIIKDTTLYLKNMPQFKGEVGLEDSKVAFKIREKIKKEEGFLWSQS